MAMKAFHIELRVTNVEDTERLLAIRKALQAAGRQLHAAAMLICGGEEKDNEPEIILYGEDFSEGREEIAAQDKGTLEEQVNEKLASVGRKGRK